MGGTATRPKREEPKKRRGGRKGRKADLTLNGDIPRRAIVRGGQPSGAAKPGEQAEAFFYFGHRRKRGDDGRAKRPVRARVSRARKPTSEHTELNGDMGVAALPQKVGSEQGAVARAFINRAGDASVTF